MCIRDSGYESTQKFRWIAHVHCQTIGKTFVFGGAETATLNTAPFFIPVAVKHFKKSLITA